MIRHRLLLSSVAFSVGFVLGLLIHRDFKRAFLTGFIAVPATFSGVIAVNRKQMTRQKPVLNALQLRIRQLESWEIELLDSLSALTEEKQRTEVNLNFLTNQLSQLHTQIAEQRNYQQRIYQDLIALGQQRQQLEVDLSNRQAQIQDLEQQRRELDQFVWSLKAEKRNARSDSSFLPTEFQQLQAEITERQNQKEKIERDLAQLNQLNLKEQEKSHDLQTQIQNLETTKADLTQSLLVLAALKQKSEKSVNSLQVEFSQLQAQIQELEKRKVELVSDKDSQPLSEIVTVPPLLETPPDFLAVDSNQEQIQAIPQEITENLDQKSLSLPEPSFNLEALASEEQLHGLSQEWQEFIIRSPKYELMVLKALIEPGNQSAKIKKIAEDNLIMPEPLIDFINERALKTIGDLIIEPSHGSTPPSVVESYLTNVREAIRMIPHLQETDGISELPEEWQEFMARIPKYELMTLRALLESENQSAKLKQIAEENVIMPEILIDLINERALNIIGELIIEPSNESFAFVIPEEYLLYVKKVVEMKKLY